jgi:hypothetical protein
MMMRRLLFTLAAFVTVLGVPVRTQSLDGVYTTTGTNPDGKTYAAVLEIKAFTGTTYQFRWTTGRTRDGDWESFGYGYVVDGRLVINIFHPYPTVADYTHVNGAWHGRWSVVGSGQVLTEEFTRSDKSADALKQLLPHPDSRAL